MTWFLIVAGVLLALFIGQFIVLFVVLAREDRETVGLGYFGRAPQERHAFKRSLERRARLLRPAIALVGRTSSFDFERTSFEARGLYGPRGTCDVESFEKGFDYEPRPEDVFVVTQMKCGTTWMQHLVYETLERGRGSLVASGTALYAVSPWLEARKSVPVEKAPLVGRERPSRIIKTHLPRSHCPGDGGARYIYVSRHPASCFASCADFLRANAGPVTVDLEDVRRWFTSERMWWGPWPDHVAAWWRTAREEDDILFVRFEDMVEDLPAVARRVAAFLGLDPLDGDEVERITEKCGFEYMRTHRETFEMHPPHLFAVDAELFVRGTADRHRDVPPELKERILAWCRSEMEGGEPTLATLYPGTGRAARGEAPPEPS